MNHELPDVFDEIEVPMNLGAELTLAIPDGAEILEVYNRLRPTPTPSGLPSLAPAPVPVIHFRHQLGAAPIAHHFALVPNGAQVPPGANHLKCLPLGFTTVHLIEVGQVVPENH